MKKTDNSSTVALTALDTPLLAFFKNVRVFATRDHVRKRGGK